MGQCLFFSAITQQKDKQFHKNVLRKRCFMHLISCQFPSTLQFSSISYNRYQLHRVKAKMLPPGHMKPAIASFLNAGRAASQSSIMRSEESAVS